MKVLQIFLTLLSLPAISLAQSSSSKSIAQPKCNQFVYERLRNYFETNEQRPTQVFNNTEDPGRWEPKTQKIIIGGQTVEWIDDVTKNNSKSSVRINGELISLADKTTVNTPDKTRKFTLDVIGEWYQIKLYQLYDQTLIAISMGPKMCTGLMCSVGAQLWYDIKTKQKTFFGTYQTDLDVRLFRFPHEDSFYIVGTNFKGDPHGETSPTVITYELYKLLPNGEFQIQKNSAGLNYFIRHTSFPRVKSARTQNDILDQNWVEDVLAKDQ